MKIEWGKAFKTGIFLACIAGAAALILSGVNVVTSKKIEENRVQKEAKGLRRVFGEAAYGEAIPVENNKNISKYWNVNLGEGKEGRVYSVSGTNSYGSVSLLVGIYGDYSLGNIFVLENTESYATTLQDGYLTPYIQAEDKETVIDNVRCGATYGAKLCRDLILTARSHYKGGNE
ncbi:MAG: hypothetical protein E7179_05900 [Erysipelotrichaceae bacterium]|jgi:hypothetical protein|nr:hypothetical protein [Erysipelotrichaceae bacterium]